jgi:hypothetical protein
VESSELDLVAASLRADAADLDVFVEVLARKLAASFPGHVQVERPRRLLGGERRVRKLAVTFGDDSYELERDVGGVTCVRRALVRGIAIRSEQLELGPWIDQLARSLVAAAESTAEGRAVLAELLE